MEKEFLYRKKRGLEEAMFGSFPASLGGAKIKVWLVGKDKILGQEEYLKVKPRVWF